MIARAHICFLVALTILCGNSSAVFAQSKAPETVIEIRLEGLYRVPKASILAKLKTRVGGPLEPAVVTSDLKRLFTMRSFDDVKIATKSTPKGVIVLFLFDERPTINSIKFWGNDALGLDELKKVININLFETADSQRIKENIQKIKELYIDEGYYLADVSYRLKKLGNNLVNLQFTIDEGDKVKVTSISFLGNKLISDKEIKAIMQTREGGYFSFLTSSGQYKKELLEQDTQRIHLFYLTKGFIHIKVDSPVVTLSPDKSSIDITIHLTEGDSFRVNKVDVSGDLLFKKEELLALVELQPGKVFDYMLMQRDSTTLSDKYKDLGYANATVSNSHVANIDDKTVDFTYIIQKGIKVHIGRIDIKGNTSTRDKVIRRVMKIAEGDLYSSTLLKKSKQMVMRMGFFESVFITTDPGANERLINVTVRVKERQTGTFQVGAGFSSLESFIATAQISKQNFMGHGQTMSIQATLSSIRSLYTLSFFDPYFLDSMWTFSIDLYNFQQDYDDFTRGSTGGNLTWGYRFTDELHVNAGYKLEHVGITVGGLSGSSATPIANLFNDGLTSSLKSTISFDTRNDRMFPSAGQFTTASVEYAHKSLGSDNEFTRMIGRSRWYQKVFWDIVLKLNGTVGYVLSNSEKAVPIFERFFVGGIFNVRGFQRNSLGPKLSVAQIRDPGTGLSKFTIGGNKQLILNAELEIPILPQVGIRGVLFFDAGNAFNNEEDISIMNLRTSVGFGFRWWSPVGPLRFEWGIPLQPLPGEDPIVFEFTIGNSF